MTDPSLDSVSQSSNPESTASEETTQSFEELRLDVMIVRRDVEKLARYSPPDYSVTLGEIKKSLGAMNHRLGKLEQRPALQMNPALLQEQIAERSQLVMREPILQFDRARQAAEQTQQQLAALVGAVRQRGHQLRALLMTAAFAFIIGLVLSPLVTHFLPFGLDTRVAAVIIGTDRWRAGAELMHAGSPAGWDAIERAISISRLNRNAIQICQDVATKTHKAQRCDISIFPAALDREHTGR